MLLLFVSLSFAQVVARVNNEAITKEELNRLFTAYWKEIIHLPVAQADSRDVNNFLIEYVRSKIILNEAKRMGISVSEAEFEEYIRRNIGSQSLSPIVRDMVRVEVITQKILDVIAKDVKVSDNQITAYYYLNLRDFKIPARVLLRRIYAEDLDTANEVYSRLLRGISFKGLRAKEGESMWYSIQALPSLVKKQLHPYEVGKVSKPIDTGAGYLILQVMDRRGGGIMPLEEAKPMVREKLLREKKEEVFKQWLQRVSKDYRLEFYSLH